MSPHNDPSLPHIVVIGAGFAGLTFIRHFPERLGRITVIDRQNHHVFQPLLYQVATAGLSATDIAQPIRGVFGARPNLEVLMSEVTAIDPAAKRVHHERGEVVYDYLVLAAGAATSYFGHEDWEQHAPGLKTLDDALRIRRRMLTALERAETEADPAKRDAAMTVVVIGGGPTGVELAGAFAELTRRVLKRDFDHIDPTKVRVVLIQGGPRVLPPFDETLSARAEEKLRDLGVEVRTGRHVEGVGDGQVMVGGETIRAATIVWAAGVRGEPIGRKMGVETDRDGRIPVLPDLSIRGYPEAFAIGDIATLKDANGVIVPGVAQGAMQMARHCSGVIERELRGDKLAPSGRKPFAYCDKGSMATIGRSAAVAEIGNLKLSGFPAWAVWLAVHIVFLIGFRSKFAVILQWTYSYFTYKSGARIITGVSGERAAGSA